MLKFIYTIYTIILCIEVYVYHTYIDQALHIFGLHWNRSRFILFIAFYKFVFKVFIYLLIFYAL